jgi:hypothetical protein
MFNLCKCLCRRGADSEKSLEILPFPSDYFDFVRCVRLGFHVPEDEVRGHQINTPTVY